MQNVLVLIDIQKEYITPGRPFYLKGIETSLENCRKLLIFARKRNWEIVHVQHSNGDTAERFNPKTTYFDFIEGFEPLLNEKHFIKNDFSCYSNLEFASYLDNQLGEREIYIIGYNTVMCCLSTLEEARRKGHKMHLVADASYAKAIDDNDEAMMHKVMLSVYQAKKLATIIRTQDVIARPI